MTVVQSASDKEVRFDDSLVKKYRGLLNKLTPENCDKLLADIVQLINSGSNDLGRLVDELFEKTCGDSEYSHLYALLCSRLEEAQQTVDRTTRFLYRVVCKYQYEFQERRSTPNKQKTIAAMRFIGHLFLVGVLNEAVMHKCLRDLLRSKQSENIANPVTRVEDDLVYFCKIMEVTGEQLDTPNAGSNLIDQYMSRAKSLIAKYKIQPRIRFMVENLDERRANHWAARKPKPVFAQEESPLKNSRFKAADQSSRQGIMDRRSSRRTDSSGSSLIDNSEWRDGRRTSESQFPPARAFVPTILRRGMENEILSALERVQKSKERKEDVDKKDDGTTVAIDSEVEAFMTNPVKKFQSTINNIKLIVFSRGHSSHLVYSIIKQSLPYGDVLRKPTDALLKELCSSGVVNGQSCQQGIDHIISEIPELESTHCCVKSHVARMATYLYNLHDISLSLLLKNLHDQPKLSGDALLQFSLILLQSVDAECGRSNCVEALQQALVMEPALLRKFNSWNSADHRYLPNLLRNRGLDFLLPYFCPEHVISELLVRQESEAAKGLYTVELLRSPTFVGTLVECIVSFVRNCDPKSAKHSVKLLLDNLYDQDKMSLRLVSEFANGKDAGLVVEAVDELLSN